MLPDPFQASVWCASQIFLPEYKYLFPLEETPEAPELGGVKAAVYVGENPVLEGQCFAAAGLLLFQRMVKVEWIVSSPVLHCPV